MKQIIRLTESDLHRIINESVESILNELSTDTLDAASDKAFKKYLDKSNEHGDNDIETKHAYDQYRTFQDEYENRYTNGNDAAKARIMKNRRDRDSGKRSYVSGKGWRTE